MTLDIRKQCAVCAWRGDCAKKYTIKETALHCQDFCRDRSLAAKPPSEGAPDRHRRVEDVFGKGGG